LTTTFTLEISVAGCRQGIDVIAPTPEAKPMDMELLQDSPVDVRSWTSGARMAAGGAKQWRQ
jgi:hypothetical protein